MRTLPQGSQRFGWRMDRPVIDGQVGTLAPIEVMLVCHATLRLMNEG
jgi:hypothetical protein